MLNKPYARLKRTHILAVGGEKGKTPVTTACAEGR